MIGRNCRCLSMVSIVLLSNCIGFGQVERQVQPAYATDLPAQLSAPREMALRLRLTAWGNHERYVEDVRAALAEHGFRESSSDSTPDLLEVVLEESGTTPGMLRFLNLLATLASGTLIPFYNQVNYHLSFRHFRNGQLLSACRYGVRNHEAISILGLPLAPFQWSTIALSGALQEAVAAYAQDCGAAR